MRRGLRGREASGPLGAALALAAASVLPPVAPAAAQSPVPSSDCPSEIGENAAVWIAGQVHDAGSGVPLPGAEVELTWREDGGIRRVSAETDPTGVYRFCRVPPDLHLTVHASAAGRQGAMFAVDTRAGEAVVRQDLEVALSDAEEGRLVGRVVDRSNGRGVEAASIRLEPLGVEAATRYDGRFVFQDVPSGDYTLRLSHVAYGEHETEVTVTPEETVEVQMAVSEEPVEMEPLEVTVRHRYRPLERRGFYERMHWADAHGGEFITPEIIERRKPSRISHLLNGLPGVRVWENCSGGVCQAIPYFRRGFGCVSARGRVNQPPVVFIDGVEVDIQQSVQGINQFSPSSVRAIEVYEGPAQTPAEFTSIHDRCGTIVIWTKKGPDRRSRR